MRVRKTEDGVGVVECETGETIPLRCVDPAAVCPRIVRTAGALGPGVMLAVRFVRPRRGNQWSPGARRR